MEVKPLFIYLEILFEGGNIRNAADRGKVRRGVQCLLWFVGAKSLIFIMS
jgi:hypothetical protein